MLAWLLVIAIMGVGPLLVFIAVGLAQGLMEGLRNRQRR